MQHIKIFLASSITEFEEERKILGDYMNRLNAAYVDKGIFIELLKCEDMSKAINKDRKQAEYNEQIKKSNFFYILIGKEIGEYTLEEFDVALAAFKATGAPNIFTYFKKVGAEESASESALSFMERLDRQIGHYYSFFEHIDSIKLDILLELVLKTSPTESLVFEDGQAKLGNNEIMSLRNIPMYAKNTSITNLTQEIDSISDDMSEAAIDYGKNPGNAALLNRMLTTGAKHADMTKELHELEANLLALCKNIYSVKDGEGVLTNRARQANTLLMAGDYEGALALLNDAEREKELEAAEALIEAGKNAVEGYYHEEVKKVKILLSLAFTDENYEKIKESYERILDLTKKHGFTKELVLEYAVFLKNHYEMDRAIEVLESFSLEEADKTSYESLSLDTHLSEVYMHIHEFGKALRLIDSLSERFEIMEKKLKKNLDAFPDNFEYEYMHIKLRFLHTAEWAYEMASDYSRALVYEEATMEELHRLLKKYHGAKQPSTIMVPYITAIGTATSMHSLTANKLYKEAQEVYREYIDASNPSGIALYCSMKLAGISLEKDQEATYKEMLDLLKDLVAEDPMRYTEQLNQTSLYYADLLIERKMTAEAKSILTEALLREEAIKKGKQTDLWVKLSQQAAYVEALEGDTSRLAKFLPIMLGHEHFAREAIELRKKFDIEVMPKEIWNIVDSNDKKAKSMENQKGKPYAMLKIHNIMLIPIVFDWELKKAKVISVQTIERYALESIDFAVACADLGPKEMKKALSVMDDAKRGILTIRSLSNGKPHPTQVKLLDKLNETEKLLKDKLKSRK